ICDAFSIRSQKEVLLVIMSNILMLIPPRENIQNKTLKTKIKYSPPPGLPTSSLQGMSSSA
ncbi:hypothetical protein DPMN_120743, partial [Dreissena polymorpha]